MNYYEMLGVAKNATPEEIKKSYRKLASQHHPDRGGDTATFQQIQQAYDTLSDDKKRKEYDNPAPQGFPGGFHFSARGFDINDIFGQMFAQQGFPQQRGHIFRTQVGITLEDAYNGSTTKLQLQTPNGLKIIDINIPKGAQNGMQLRYENIIENGTLVVEFRINPHLRFDLRGHDLYCNHSVSVLDLIVGTNFEFTTIAGKTFEVKIKPKTQPNSQLKLPQCGMPIPNTPIFGDQIILLKPYIPDIIDERISQSILQSKGL